MLVLNSGARWRAERAQFSRVVFECVLRGFSRRVFQVTVYQCWQSKTLITILKQISSEDCQSKSQLTLIISISVSCVRRAWFAGVQPTLVK
jgi:hypothetical protein